MLALGLLFLRMYVYMCVFDFKQMLHGLTKFLQIGQLDFAAATDIIRCTLAPSAGDFEQ